MINLQKGDFQGAVMVDFTDRENLTNRSINIDDAAAVISLLLIEVYHDLAPAKEFEDKLIGLASRMLTHAKGVKIENRRAFVECISAYLISTEPGAGED